MRNTAGARVRVTTTSACAGARQSKPCCSGSRSNDPFVSTSPPSGSSAAAGNSAFPNGDGQGSTLLFDEPVAIAQQDRRIARAGLRKRGSWRPAPQLLDDPHASGTPDTCRAPSAAAGSPFERISSQSFETLQHKRNSGLKVVVSHLERLPGPRARSGRDRLCARSSLASAQRGAYSLSMRTARVNTLPA